MLSDKTPETAVYYTVEADGSGTVIQIRIRGESAEHIIALRLATERPTTSP